MELVTSGRTRTAVVAAVAVSALAATGAAFGGAPAETVRFDGGDAFDEVLCQNAAVAPVVQHNRCQARAEGGHVSLQDVDIHFDGRAVVQVNGGEVDVISVGGGDAGATAVCVNDAGGTVTARSIDLCRSRAQGGAVTLRNVQVVLHRRDGSVVVRRRDLRAVATRPPRSEVRCASLAGVAPACDARAGGGAVEMRNVDLVERSGRTRTNIDVSVTGGDATAIVRCHNSATGVRVQINHCSATAEGGDATLRDVRLHAYE